jgi:hypothetical protein
MAPSICLSDEILSTPTSTGDTDIVSQQRSVALVVASGTLEANKKESQTSWGSNLALRLPRKPRPLFIWDLIVQQHSCLDVYGW